MQNKIFFIIATFNGFKWLPECIESIVPYPIVVIDNNSTDNTVSYLKENYPEVVIIELKENIGFGQANNLGIKAALELGAEAVFLLNQDAYVEPGCIEKLMKAQIRHPEYGILSPVHLDGKGNRLDQRFSHYLNYQANPDFYSDFVLNKPKKEIYDVPFVNAAGWLLSKKCIEKVGGFDPIFFHYGEDDNYCQRVHYHGFKIGVCPDAALLHDREDRPEPRKLLGSKQYFQSLERHTKLKYADINIPLNSELEKFINRRKRAWIKAVLKFDLSTASIKKKEYLLLKRIKPEIIKSRDINKTKNLNHLNLDQ